ncbi:hypothetical protein BASA50_011344 [Batrachochytrium salamandrivorans]|uniref:Uncharacterized protein n=1 Tax=Batrachochytrium salamandrivorans TaxID=1357716 RepID=A0ABQ8EW01_9FUNG|nr:hypothetical protein BASA50_011344 [Batrachochytrium salamandrivorans]
MPKVFCESDRHIRFHETQASHTHSSIGWIGTTSQFSQLPQGNPGGIVPQCGLILLSILPAKSRLTVAASTRLSCLTPNRLMLHSPVPISNWFKICVAIQDSTVEPNELQVERRWKKRM